MKLTTHNDVSKTAHTDADLEVRGVGKSFIFGQGKRQQHKDAIEDISFSIPSGTFLSILGPSGCGKSTLLRLIDGLQRPTTGQILINGREVTGPGLDRGFVFQSPNLLPWRTVIDNIKFGLEPLGIPRHERAARAADLLSTVGLEAYANYYPSQLSGGMQQRVGLARALAIEPSMLLMDEPFAAVDAQTRLALQEELERIWLLSENTVVFITHDIEEAIFLSDRVLVMSKSPGTIIDQVDIGFPRPRDWDIRGTPEFAALVHRILGGLRGSAS